MRQAQDSSQRHVVWVTNHNPRSQVPSGDAVKGIAAGAAVSGSDHVRRLLRCNGRESCWQRTRAQLVVGPAHASARVLEEFCLIRTWHTRARGVSFAVRTGRCALSFLNRRTYGAESVLPDNLNDA